MKNLQHGWWLACVCLLVPACTFPVVKKTVAVTTLYASSQCRLHSHSASIVYLTNTLSFNNALNQVTRNRPVLSNTIDVNFEKNAVLIVGLGTQSTTGYAVQNNSKNATLHAGILSLALQWQRPLEGRAQPQVITHPCLFLKIPRHDYQYIHIIDQNNRLRLQYSIASH